MRNLARAAVLTIVAAFALSGCIRYDIDMTLSQDNTASGSIVQAVKKGSSEQMQLPDDDAALAQLFGDSPFGADFKAQDYKEDDWVGKKYAFDAVPISELDGFADVFTVTRDGDVFTVVGAEVTLTEDGKNEFPPGAEAKVKITFPGEVTSHNGTLDGKTVTWDLVAMTEPIQATAQAVGPDSGSSIPAGLLIGGGIALVVLVGAAITVILLRRRNAPVATVDSFSVASPAPLAPPAPPAPPAELAPPAPPAELAPPAPPAADGEA